MVDVPGDLTTNATIAVGTPITGAIETVGDDDWYKVNLTAGQKVTIAVNLGTLEECVPLPTQRQRWGDRRK